MCALKHVVLTNPNLNGFEYGVLRDFEDEISRVTGGVQISTARPNLSRFVEKRIGHGMRYDGLRRFVSKAEFEIEADVLWVVLMGPENYTLDLLKGWDRNVGVKILYLFDTFEKQLPLIRRVLKAAKWDYTISSFEGALPLLEEQTGRKWHAVPQGVKLDRFRPAPEEERVIDFCAYGRRLKPVHDSIKSYCLETNKYYDYTTAASLQTRLDAREPYGQYAWHLTHSLFNFCWPVELTHPDRVLTFSPVTCRWFEAAASANVVVGKAPANPNFTETFGVDFVLPIEHTSDSEKLREVWDELWERRHELLQSATERRARLSTKWSWESRVNEVLSVIAAG